MNTNSNLTGLNVAHKAARIQQNRKRHGLEDEKSKAHAHVPLGFLVGLIVSIGQSLSVWTKFHPSRLFMGVLLGVALVGLFSALGVFVLF